MDKNEKAKLIIECERLRVFLGRNQLVQANAIVQKVEGIIVDILTKETKPEDLEKHPLWLARRSAHNVQSEILGGFTKKAEDESNVLAEMLRK